MKMIKPSKVEKNKLYFYCTAAEPKHFRYFSPITIDNKVYYYQIVGIKNKQKAQNGALLKMLRFVIDNSNWIYIKDEEDSFFVECEFVDDNPESHMIEGTMEVRVK